MRGKRGIEVLGLLIIFFFTAYVAFIASNSQHETVDDKSDSIGLTKEANSADSASIEVAKKLYRNSSFKHSEVQKMIIEKTQNQ